MTEPGDVLAEVISFRRAARAIVRDASLDRHQKYAALMRLAILARTEAAFPRAAQGVVADEAIPLLHPGMHPAPIDPAEREARRLRAQGYGSCPTCLRSLPTNAELDRWRRLAEDAAMRAARREALVP